MLEQRYEPLILTHGFDALGKRDHKVGKFLELANRKLPEDQRYSFYVVEYIKNIARPDDNGKSCLIIMLK